MILESSLPKFFEEKEEENENNIERSNRYEISIPKFSYSTNSKIRGKAIEKNNIAFENEKNKEYEAWLPRKIKPSISKIFNDKAFELENKYSVKYT